VIEILAGLFIESQEVARADRFSDEVYGVYIPRQKITTFLWFDNQAEEAANFYVSLFKDSRVTSVNPMIVTL